MRNLRGVLEALIEWGQKEKDSVLLAEYVRIALKRHISHKHSSGQNILPACWRPMSRNPARRHPPDLGRQLSGAGPAAGKALLENIKRTVGDLGNAVQKPVLLTSMDIRRYLRKMIEQDLYELPVLSYQELTQEINVQPLARWTCERRRPGAARPVGPAPPRQRRSARWSRSAPIRTATSCWPTMASPRARADPPRRDGLDPDAGGRRRPERRQPGEPARLGPVWLTLAATDAPWIEPLGG